MGAGTGYAQTTIGRAGLGGIGGGRGRRPGKGSWDEKQQSRAADDRGCSPSVHEFTSSSNNSSGSSHSSCISNSISLTRA